LKDIKMCRKIKQFILKTLKFIENETSKLVET